MDSERGFSLVEVLIAAGISVMLAAMLVVVAHAFIGWSHRASASGNAQAGFDRLEEPFTTESAGAWSVFVPATDVLGMSNADGHELDIATEDALRRPSFRASRYDAGAATLSEYVYGAPSDTPIATGDVTTGVTAFSAINGSASTLAGPLFANATIADADVPLQLGSPEAIGGNRLTQIRVLIGTFEREMTLASATAPTSYTVVLRYTPAP
ncbi:MAG: prepilin-type N-terminal cleavage/methylation domain-containing protein [Candidatus Eremiobacteraeota bacterium]|nr:prepilin-type N-terminal cleavage/methylation domain-containing protein [Candidatus Eremiobacteraeota bacterium]